MLGSVEQRSKPIQYFHTILSLIDHAQRDRATFDANLSEPVNYTVASPADAPLTLTYGPSFFDLAGELRGDVTIGLNRQLNNIENTRAGAEEAVQRIKGLLTIELGNEPDRTLFVPAFTLSLSILTLSQFIRAALR